MKKKHTALYSRQIYVNILSTITGMNHFSTSVRRVVFITKCHHSNTNDTTHMMNNIKMLCFTQ